MSVKHRYASSPRTRQLDDVDAVLEELRQDCAPEDQEAISRVRQLTDRARRDEFAELDRKAADDDLRQELRDAYIEARRSGAAPDQARVDVLADAVAHMDGITRREVLQRLASSHARWVRGDDYMNPMPR